MAELDVWPGFVDKVLSFVDADAIRPLKVAIDAANGMAGVMLSPVLERLPQLDVVACNFEPDGSFPQPRAEPAQAREPGVHHRADARRRCRPGCRLRRRRRPVLLRRRHGRVRARGLRHRAPRRGGAGEGAGRQGDLRRASQLGGATGDRGSRRRRAREPRRARVHQAPHAQGRRGLRRRGVGALLLPRLLPGRHRRGAVPGHARAALEARPAALRAPRPVPRAVLHHRRDQHARSPTCR